MGRGLHHDGHEVQGRYEMLNTITKISLHIKINIRTKFICKNIRKIRELDQDRGPKVLKMRDGGGTHHTIDKTVLKLHYWLMHAKFFG